MKKNPKQIILSETADAIYVKNDDILYFKKIETITPIFRKIESLYREATKTEVTNFLGRSFVNIGSEYNVDKVGKANRQRLALTSESFSKLDSQQKDVIFK